MAGLMRRVLPLSLQFAKGVFVKRTPRLHPSAALGCRAYASAWTTAQCDDPSRAKELNRQARVDLAAVYRILDDLQFGEGVCNHITLMAPAQSGHGNVMLLIPYGLHWSEVTASSLVGLDDKLQVVEGDGMAETTAACIHTELHRARPDASCVLHVHPPYSTAIGLLKDCGLLMVHQNSARFFKNVAYDRSYSGLADVSEEGRRLGEVIGDKEILVMCNHGVVAAMPNTAQAFDHVYYFERASMFQVLAMSCNSELDLIPKPILELTWNQSRKNLDFFAKCHFDAMKRALLRRCPDFAD
ncbi:PREDICTED: putative aldolase class 2 protein CC_1201 [Priapulus caudatus]|uniref:Aldolase class 2 protein CC_1201 n=1 Tax=Priapulus caudatus TaxID=37621 RepID=A0ABM1ES35_PRICU|nr:PREDICTED: putative aldolase class 2 protein CC_1201 [Priapulus caudatus]